VTAVQLANTPLVVREYGSGTRDALENALAAHRLTVTIALQLGSTTAIRAAVSAGGCPAVLSHLTVFDDLEAARLVAIPVADGINLTRRFHAIWFDGSTPVAAAKTLVAVAVKETIRNASRTG
jgi:DNA-binding transcriptional LysR family regulator